MEGLVYFQPVDGFGRVIQVHEPVEKKASNKNLRIAPGLVVNFDILHAWRELLMNFIDGTNKVSGDEILTNTIMGQRIIRHSKTHIYGEITWSEKEICFSNISPEITSVRSILHIGASVKQGDSSQVGQFGEGLKRTAMCLLLKGYQVEIYFPIRAKSRTEFKQGQFYLENNTLGCRTELVSPFELGSGDYHRFQVNVRIPSESKDVLDFDICRHLFEPDTPLYSGSKGKIFMSTNAGRVFLHDFYLCQYPELYFCYNFSSKESTRDRDGIKDDQLSRHVGEIWNAAILEDPAMVREFYRFLMDPGADRTREASAFKHISDGAVNMLISHFKIQHPSRIACLEEDCARYRIQFHKNLFYPVPRHMVYLFGRISKSIQKILDDFVANFKKTPPMVEFGFPDWFYQADKLKYTITWINRPDSPVHYAFAPITRCLYVNVRNAGKDEVFNDLLFTYCPAIAAEMNETFLGIDLIKPPPKVVQEPDSPEPTDDEIELVQVMIGKDEDEWTPENGKKPLKKRTEQPPLGWRWIKGEVKVAVPIRKKSKKDV